MMPYNLSRYKETIEWMWRYTYIPALRSSLGDVEEARIHLLTALVRYENSYTVTEEDARLVACCRIHEFNLPGPGKAGQ